MFKTINCRSCVVLEVGLEKFNLTYLFYFLYPKYENPKCAPIIDKSP